MSIIYVLIPLAILIVIIALAIFFWAVKSNQFEDLDRQGYSILFDDDLNNKASELRPNENNQTSNSPEKSPHAD